jgi:hypothetical protein
VRKSKLEKPRTVDNSVHYRRTAYPRRDAVFNYVVKMYEKKGKVWQTSDDLVFGGFLYFWWDWFTVVMFLWFVYFVATWTYDRHGLFRGVAVIAVMALLRINALIREVRRTNKILSGEE